MTEDNKLRIMNRKLYANPISVVVSAIKYILNILELIVNTTLLWYQGFLKRYQLMSIQWKMLEVSFVAVNPM